MGSKEWQGSSDSLRHSTASYQIFLSFRGDDTHKLTSTLYGKLRNNGFKTFMDNQDVLIGRLSKHAEAIQDSRLSIVVLSMNYPKSRWCLDELVLILEGMETKKQLVWPVFYKVEPIEIRYQTGVCKGVMTKLENRFPDKIPKWKNALRQVCSLSGRCYKEGMDKDNFIQQIVDEVINVKYYLYVGNAGAPYPLSMALKEQLKCNYATLEELSKELQNERVNQIVLQGKQGSGKTRLVEAVRDITKSTFTTLFQLVLFATVSSNDTRSIQDQIAGGLDLKLDNEEGLYGRAKKIEKKLDEMKKQILVIFDDVPANFDSEKIIGIPCEDERCKFLLTTRSRKNFSSAKYKEGELRLRKTISMRPLSEMDALALLEEHSEIEDDDDESLSKVLSVANEITKEYKWWPGEIIEIGSSLKHKPLEEWQGLLDSLRTARFQIFLSFEGRDTREHFTSTLYAELRKNGLKTFMNGGQISTNLVKDSRLSIVVLSVNYPNSSCCLDELVLILECMETKKQLVWPVFYKVEPKEIRYQTGLCEGVMTKLENRFPNKIPKWKNALHQVCSLSGSYYKEGMSQHTFIPQIVDNVMKAKNYLYIRSEAPSSLMTALKEHLTFNFATLMGPQNESINQISLHGKQGSGKTRLVEAGNADGEFEAECPKTIVNSESQSESSGSGAPNPLLMALKAQLKYNSETLVELSKELQNERINQIALYGKPGSGKTRLVEAVRDKSKSILSTLFDVVLFATVSKNDTMSIQDEIARGLDLKLDKRNSRYKRAQEIEKKLIEMKEILVILDDVPESFDPQDILGIPSTGQRCKFLLTTCSKKGFLLLNSEENRKSIRMHPLSAENALALLREHSEIEDGSDDESSSSKVLTVAKEISSEHKWMPGEIVKIGSSLKGKTCKEWQGLLDSLRHSTARYQIFLNFRGDDTRAHFTDTLYEELESKGFQTFTDNRVQAGDDISTELVKAIEDSRLSIVVLSKNYPDSWWCLEELVHILECMNSKKQYVLPVFYEVEPKDIRHQKGLCKGVMTKLEERYPHNIPKWKEALRNVCSFSGLTYKMGTSKRKFIRDIVLQRVFQLKNYMYIRNMEMDQKEDFS